MKTILSALCAVALFAGQGVAQSTAHAPRPATTPATIDSTTSFDMVSKINQEAYRIQVFLPKGKPPVSGFPVLYVLDGNVLFGTFAGAMHNQSQASELESAVVVGIASGPGKSGGDRTYDFTAYDLTAHEKEISVDLGPNPLFGGYDKFFRVVQEEIKPAVAKLARVDETRSALFGWSLGGLFVVHTMLTHPEAFHSYAALSPSLWRTDRQAFTEIPGFEHAATERRLRPEFFLGVGSLEEQASPGMLKWNLDQAKLAEEIKYARMTGNAKDFAAKVGPFFEERKLPYDFQIFQGDTHNGVPWDAVNPVLKFLFPLLTR